MGRMIKAIIFDCFGVVITDNIDGAYSKMGGDPAKDREFIAKIMNDANKDKIAGSVPAIAERLGVEAEAWREASSAGRENNHELLAYTKELKTHYKIAMLTNVGSGGVRRFFDEGFLEQFFDPIVESGMIGFAKPEPQAYEIAAERLGLRTDECVFVDDRQEYVEGAQAVGMESILYQSFAGFKHKLEEVIKN